jgi:hypothetical protein
MIKIFGHNYRYIHERNLARDRGAQGQSCGNSCEIIYDKSLPETSQEEALIHEIIEQINYNLELSLEHPKITCLGTSIHQVIKDNPHIFTMRLPDEDE